MDKNIMKSEVSTELDEGAGAVIGKVVGQAGKKLAKKFATNVGKDLIQDLAKELLDSGNIEDFIFKAFEHLDKEGAQAIWGLLIDTVQDVALQDRALTEEDKEALVRKLNINRDLLDGVDTVASAISIILDVAPTALGVLWDIFELGPIDEALGLTLGGWGAVVFGILSLIPEGTLIGILTSASIKLQKNVLKWVKDIVIHNIIPEPPKEAVLQEDFKNNHIFKKSTLATEFKLYESLWD